MEMTRLCNAEGRSWKKPGGIIQGDCSEERRGAQAPAWGTQECTCERQRWKSQKVKGKPGEGDDPEAKGQRFARREDPHGQAPEKLLGWKEKGTLALATWRPLVGLAGAFSEVRLTEKLVGVG